MNKEGYRTKSKSEILNYLERNSDKRVSVADIMSYMEENHIDINRATVYRNLEKLTLAGDILKYKTSDKEMTVYQCIKNRDGCNSHLHLQCERCGRIIHLECGFMHLISDHLLADHGFELKCSGSVLLGTCSRCRKELTENSENR